MIDGRAPQAHLHARAHIPCSSSAAFGFRPGRRFSARATARFLHDLLALTERHYAPDFGKEKNIEMTSL